jgi:hypothetical protein
MREEMLSLPSPLSLQFFVLSRPFSEVTPRHTFFILVKFATVIFRSVQSS